MKTNAKWLSAALCVMVALAAGAVRGQEATYTVKMMTPETALKAAQAALKKCRDDGFQVTVAVVDRIGDLRGEKLLRHETGRKPCG